MVLLLTLVGIGILLWLLNGSPRLLPRLPKHEVNWYAAVGHYEHPIYAALNRSFPETERDALYDLAKTLYDERKCASPRASGGEQVHLSEVLDARAEIEWWVVGALEAISKHTDCENGFEKTHMGIQILFQSLRTEYSWAFESSRGGAFKTASTLGASGECRKHKYLLDVALEVFVSVLKEHPVDAIAGDAMHIHEEFKRMITFWMIPSISEKMDKIRFCDWL